MTDTGPRGRPRTGRTFPVAASTTRRRPSETIASLPVAPGYNGPAAKRGSGAVVVLVAGWLDVVEPGARLRFGTAVLRHECDHDPHRDHDGAGDEPAPVYSSLRRADVRAGVELGARLGAFVGELELDDFEVVVVSARHAAIVHPSAAVWYRVEGDVAIDAGLLGQPEHSFADNVALNLVGPTPDRQRRRGEEQRLPVAVRITGGGGAEESHGQRRVLAKHVASPQLHARALGAGTAHARRCRAPAWR